MSEPKQVIILRKDLNMRKGKLCAQAAHASLKVCIDLMKRSKMPKAAKEWFRGRFKKVVVSVNSEEELFEIHNKAQEAEIPCSLILDAGLTEFEEPTYTAVAVGPDSPERIDPITGELPLL